MQTVAAHCSHPAAPGHLACCRCGALRAAGALWPVTEAPAWQPPERASTAIAMLPGGTMVRLAMCRITS